MPLSRDAVTVASAVGVILIEDGPDVRRRCPSAVGRRGVGTAPFGVVLSVRDLFLYGGLAWWCFVVTCGRFRENLRPGSPIPDVSREACSGDVPASGSISRNIGEFPVGISGAGKRSVIVAP
jgi:hypothetical protein